MIVAMIVIAPPVQASHEELCYVFADGGNRLGQLDRSTGTETPFPNVAGVSNIEAMELDPTTGILYAIDADELGILDQTTGVYSAIGLMGSGDPGNVDMDDVDSMAFDIAGNLWGVNSSGGSDELFLINKATGAIIPDAFGPGIDYLSITGGFNQIDDIGIDPTNGTMYGINTTGSSDTIITINTTTGAAASVGNSGVRDMEGMSFDTSGQLIGTTGNNGPNATNNSFYTVNKATGVATFETALGASGIDYEAVTCMTQGVHVSDLELTKTASNATPAAGEIITFTVTVTNQGEDDATGVEVVDQLPAGLLYVSDDSGGDYTPGSGVWDIGDLANGASAVLQIQAQVVGSGTITNVAEVTASDSADPDSIPDNDDGDQSEDDEDNATITAPTSADLELTKSVNDPTPDIGDTVTFTITVTNQGQDGATGISVEDVVPVGYSNITNISGGGTLAGSTITWTGISLANGASVNLTFDADVDAPTGTLDEYLNVAQITASSQPDPDSTPNNDDGDQSEDDEDNASVVPANVIDLELNKSVNNSTPAVGDTVTFTIALTNQGPADATGVAIEDVVPAGYSNITNISGGGSLAGSTITWTGISLANGASVNLTFDADVDAPTGTLDEYLNVAQVTSADQFDIDSMPNNDDGDQSEDDEDNATVTPPGVADLELTKAVSDSTPDVGETVTFTITVTNQGPDTATGVAIEDDVPAGYSNITNISGGGTLAGSTITWTGISLASGASINLTFDADVDAPTGAADEYLNVAEVTAADQFDADSTPDNDDGDQSEDDEDNATVTPEVSDLELAKSVDNTTPGVGDTVTFTITVTNQGPDGATGISVEDVVPAGYSNITNISGGGTLAGSTITWTGITLASGASINLTFDADVDLPTGAADEYLNVAEVTAADQFDPDSTPANDDGDQSEDDEDNAAITPPGVVDLELSKTVNDPTPNVGDTVTFTITVTNQGPDTATGVAIEDVVPAGYSNITNISGTGVLAGSTITWTGISLANGASVNLTFDADVDAPNGAADEYLNISEVTASDQFDIDSTPDNDDGDQSEDDEDNASVTPQQADLELTKDVDNSTPGVGDTVTFTITVTNQGPDTATGVAIEDVVPAGYSNITNISGTGVLAGSTITWTGISLANGASVNLTFDADVDAPNGAADEYLNISEVTASDQFDTDSAPNNDDGDQSEDDEDNAVVTPPGVADVSLNKAVNDATPNVGDTVTFTITVTNDGPDPVTGVSVEDVIPAGYSNITNVSGGGALAGSTVTWTGISLASGASINLTFDADVNAPTGAADEYLNVSQVTAADHFDPDSTPDNDDGDQSEDDEDQASVTPQQADLELTKAVDNATPGVGDTVTFTITVTNQGPDGATGISVEDVVPAGFSNIANVSGGGTLVGSTITWTGISLASGASIDLTFDADVEVPTGAADEYLNVAEVTAADQFDPDSTPDNDDGDQSEDDEDNAAVSPPEVADVELTKSVNDSTPNVGDTVTFTITVTNQGPDTATGVAIEDVIPAGYSNITNISGGGALAGSTITWTGISLSSGASINLTFDADVDAPTGAADQYLNIAEVTAADQFDVDSTPDNDDGTKAKTMKTTRSWIHRKSTSNCRRRLATAHRVWVTPSHSQSPSPTWAPTPPPESPSKTSSPPDTPTSATSPEVALWSDPPSPGLESAWPTAPRQT